MQAIQSSQDELPQGLVPRSVAVLLALGGCAWGLLLSPWMFRRDVSPLAIVVFGPGYLVTAAYIVRSIYTPPLATRRLIWMASLLVQGTWLLFCTWAMTEQVMRGRTLDEPVIFLAWWLFATVASAAALISERA